MAIWYYENKGYWAGIQRENINPFFPNVPSLYPLKTENRKVF